MAGIESEINEMTEQQKRRLYDRLKEERDTVEPDADSGPDFAPPEVDP